MPHWQSALPECQLYPGLNPRKCGQQGEERDSAPLLCSGGIPYALGSQHRKDVDLLGVGPEEGHEVIPWLEHLSCEDRLKQLGLFSLESRRLQKDLCSLSVPKETTRELKRDFLTMAYFPHTMRENGFKLKEGRFT